MNYKRPAIAGLAVATVITGSTFAATRQREPLNKVEPTKVEQTEDVRVESNETPVIQLEENTPVESVQAEQNTNDSVTLEEDTPAPVVAAPSLADQLKATVTAQAQRIAPLYKWSTESDFIAIQWACLGRTAEAGTLTQDQYDQIVTFLAPQTLADGRTQYRYFSGGCRVITDIR